MPNGNILFLTYWDPTMLIKLRQGQGIKASRLRQVFCQYNISHKLFLTRSRRDTKPCLLGGGLQRSTFGSGLLFSRWASNGGSAWTRAFVPDEIGVDQGYNLSAERLILLRAARIEDLEPDLEIRIANQNGRILRVAFSRAVQEPTLIRIGVLYIETRIQALDKIPRQMIVDPRAIIFAKDDPGFALRIPNDVLPISSGAGDEKRPLCR